jgi:hypothetical protein
MMLFIFIFNLFRVIMLWLIIPLLPIIVLLKVFKLTDKLKWWDWWMDLSQFMDIKNILMLVFKPVIMVWALSLILVILVLIKNVIKNDSTIELTDNWNVSIESTNIWTSEAPIYNSTMKSDWIVEFSMSGAKETIADIIVYFFGLFLIYFLMKMVINTKTGIWFIDNTLEGAFKWLSDMVTNLPILPIAGWVSIKSLKDWASMENVTKSMWIDSVTQNNSLPDWLWWYTAETKEEFANKAISIMWDQDIKTFFVSPEYRKMRTIREDKWWAGLQLTEFEEFYRKYKQDVPASKEEK